MFTCNFFLYFLPMYVFSLVNLDQIFFIVDSPKYKEFRSILYISCAVHEFLGFSEKT